MIGKLEGGQYFLRFINEPLYDADAWVWWGVLSVVALGAGWSFLGLAAIEIALALSVIAALILFMLASTIRLRIIPAAFAALLFFALMALPFWFFLRSNETIGVAVKPSLTRSKLTALTVGGRMYANAGET